MDVIVEIFSRLPVKTLLRFRCASKQFLSIIDSEDFVKRHLQFQSLRQKVILKSFESELLLFDMDSVDNICKVELPFYSEEKHTNIIIGSCDGLLALSNGSVDTIWNVSTRKYSILPRCLINCSCDDMNCQFADGFGRHPTSNDYMFVKIVFLRNLTEINVYSLETNSWKVINCLASYPDYWFCGDGAFVQGSLNWLGNSKTDKRNDFILSYDLRNEKLSRVLLPDSIHRCDDYSMCLKVWGDCLCVVYGSLRHPIDIWVMKEHGLKDSWIKMYPFVEGAVARWTQIWFYSNNGDQIIGTFDPCQYRKVICYDLEGGRFEIMSERLPTHILHRVTMYVESLVSPKHLTRT